MFLHRSHSIHHRSMVKTLVRLHMYVFFSGDWKFGPYVCLFWLSVDYTASTASIFNLSILSLDRYWSITSPLRYLRRRTKKRALIMIMMAWIGASMWFIPVLGWNQILRKGPSQLPGDYANFFKADLLHQHAFLLIKLDIG